MSKFSQKAFTLLEVLAIVVIVSILSVMAMTGYTELTRDTHETNAKKAMMDLSIELEKHRASNFTYGGFPTSTLDVRSGDTTTPVRYTITIVSSATGNAAIGAITAMNGVGWAMRALPATGSTGFPALLMTSDGVRCKNDTVAAVTYASCGTGTQDW